MVDRNIPSNIRWARQLAWVTEPAIATTTTPFARQEPIIMPGSGGRVHPSAQLSGVVVQRFPPKVRPHKHGEPLSSSANSDSKTNSSPSSPRKSRIVANFAAKAVSRTGVISTVVYVFFASTLALSTWGLDSLANKPINLGVVENTWFHDIFDIPIHTFMTGKTTLLEAKKHIAGNLTLETVSLADVQYDPCGERNDTCAEYFRPRHELVMYLLGSSFNLISGFELPQFVSQMDKVEFQYVNTLSGFNAPAIQYFIPGEEYAVVCTARRNRFKIAQESTIGETDSVAMCSKRAYDPDWGCENEVSMDTPTHFFRINQGKVSYLGQAPRRETYYNPGNVARLTGGPQGIGFLSTVDGIDEYNGGILTAGAPWDSTPAYLCKGTFDSQTNTGMRWQGQGRAEMTWRSISLMVTSSGLLWGLTLLLAITQFMYLPRSSVCVIPVNLAKTIVGPVVFGYACYGNYRVQVLTTYFEVNRVTSFNAEPYRLCGPAMMASVVGIMSGTAIQLLFNPLLVSPSYILTIVAVINWIIVFCLEAFVFPKQSTMLIRTCGLPSSTNCSYFSATLKNYYLSPMIATGTVILGAVVVGIIRFRSRRHICTENNVLHLFNVDSIYHLATSEVGGILKEGPGESMILDAGILLGKNMVRVSRTAIVRTPMVKYAVIYLLLPPIVNRLWSRVVGLAVVVHAEENQVTNKITFMELKDMKLQSWQGLPAYYS